MHEGLQLFHWWGTPQKKEKMAEVELATKTTTVTQTTPWLKLYLVLFYAICWWAQRLRGRASHTALRKEF